MRKRNFRKMTAVFLAISLAMSAFAAPGDAAASETEVTETETLTETETESVAETPTMAEAETKTEPETETKAQTEPETQLETKVQTEPETEAETKVQTESETEAETKAQTEPETQPETKVQTEPETEAETKAQTEPETQPETKVQTEPETQLETKAQTEIETQPETKIQTEAETKTQTEPETRPETGSSTESEFQTNAPAESEMQTETEIVIETMSETLLQQVSLMSLPEDGTEDQKVKAVQELIDSLPTLDELKAMSQDEQQEVYNRLQDTYDAYDALTVEEQAEITGGEEIFEELFTFFNSNIMPLAGETGGFIVTGGTYGVDYSYSDNHLYILTSKKLTISTNGLLQSTERINGLVKGITYNLVFNNMQLNQFGMNSGPNYTYTEFWGPVNLTLYGTNDLITFGRCLLAPSLTITAGSTGYLYIDSLSPGSANDLVIEGGDVRVCGGKLQYRRPSIGGTVVTSGSGRVGDVNGGKEYPEKAAPQVTIDISNTTDQSITVNPITASNARYSIDGSTWQESNVFTGLVPNTEYTVYARDRGDNYFGTYYGGSAIGSVNAKTAETKPDASVVSINYREETISFDSKYEVSSSSDFSSGTIITSGSSITDSIKSSGTTDSALGRLYVRVNAVSGVTPASEATEIIIPDRPAAPDAGYTATASSITLTQDSTWEYSVDGINWNSKYSFSELKAGSPYTYYVRKKATDTSFASEVQEVSATTSDATYTVSIPSQATAGGEAVEIKVDNSVTFDLGYNGQVNVKITEGIENGKLTLKREGATNTITSTLLVNGYSFTDTSKNIAKFQTKEDSPSCIQFTTPEGQAIPAGSYSGTVTFEISYNQ